MTTQPLVTRRFVLGSAGLTILALPLAACDGAITTGLIGPKITIDPSRPYRAVDPNRAAAAISAYRAQSGVGPLSVDGRLNQIAASYARHMAKLDQMSHALPPLGPLNQRLRAAGYPYATAGENLGVGYRDFDAAFEGWRRSPAHDAGLKDADMTVMGIASEHRPDSGWKTFWCLMFAKPRGMA